MYSCTLPLTSAQDGCRWVRPRPGRFTPGKDHVTFHQTAVNSQPYLFTTNRCSTSRTHNSSRISHCVRDGDKVREDGIGLDGTASCWTQLNGRCIRPEKVLIVADQSDCDVITTSYRKCICTTSTDQLNRWKSITSTARISKNVIS